MPEFPAGCGGRGLTRDRHGAHDKFVPVTFDSGVTVAAVGGDRAGHAACAAADAQHRWCQLRPVRGGTVFDVAGEDEAVVVVADLAL